MIKIRCLFCQKADINLLLDNNKCFINYCSNCQISICLDGSKIYTFCDVRKDLSHKDSFYLEFVFRSQQINIHQLDRGILNEVPIITWQQSYSSSIFIEAKEKLIKLINFI